MTGGALSHARHRIGPRPAAGRIAAHLRTQYGIEVSGLAELDLGAYRVDRAEQALWAAANAGQVAQAIGPQVVAALRARES